MAAAHLRVVTVTEENEAAKEEESWRHLLLNQEVNVRTVHDCALKKFKVAGGDVNKDRVFKSADSKPAAEQDGGSVGNDDESEYDDEDENKWQCNGVVCFTDGCKSGQLSFDHHEGVEGW